jgi:tetratricopeptide (TPR) repeat protein
MIRRWGPIAALWVVIIAAAVYQFLRLAGVIVPEAPDPPKRKYGRGKVGPAFFSPWQNDAQFIVTTICSDLAEMAYYSRHGRGLGPNFKVQIKEKTFVVDQPVYEVSARLPDGRQVSQSLRLNGCIWDPATYREWCRAFQPQARSAGGISSEAVLSQLTDPTPTHLAQLDRQLSQAGSKSMGDPEWHDQAALTIVSLALREPSGTFFQLRQELSRTCAHLVMSDCLRGDHPPSPCHQLAQAALACLYRREDVAEQLLNPLPETGAVGTWKRALRMRHSFDYRQRGQGSLLEERECFLAEFTVGSCAGAWKHRRLKKDWATLADWTRIADSVLIGHNDTPGIELGHQLVAAGIPAELAEIKQVWQNEGWGPCRIPSDLNTPPQRCVAGPADKAVVQVIGKGTWAWFLQRQLCHVGVSDWLFLEEKLGDPDGARDYARQFERNFSKLKLYPFAEYRMAWDVATYRDSLDQAGRLIRSAPESVPAYAWNWLFYSNDAYPEYRPDTIRVINEWHNHNPLPGTAYDLQPRMNHPSFFNRADFLDKLSQLQAASPHDPVLYAHLLEQLEKKGRGSNAFTLKVLAPNLDYNADAAFRMVNDAGLPPDQAEQWMTKAIALNPRYLDMRLSQGYLDDQSYERDFEQWLRSGPDSVAVANSAHRMVRIYETSGRHEQASQLAERAAQTYSILGLCTKADLLESRRQIDQALEYYQRAEERYNQVGPLVGALSRAAAQNPKYAEPLREALKRLPGGLKAYTPSSNPPKQGLLVTSDVEDLEKDDIIVAIRGYAVQTQAQYVQIRNSQMFSEFKITVYRRGQTHESGPYPAGHRFGNLKDYSST